MGKKRHKDSNGTTVPKTGRNKTYTLLDLQSIRPQSNNQSLLFDKWGDDKSSFIYGSAGTGKTFLGLYLSLIDLLTKDNSYKKIYIIRSTVPTRDLGFLPGDIDEKIAAYQEPYVQIFDSLFKYKKSYEGMKKKGLIEFHPTAFLRGTTFDDAIIFVDECQNMTFTEIDTVMTRVGINSKIVFCGDSYQTDQLAKKDNGFSSFLNIIEKMNDYFNLIRFTHEDVVRSGMVKEYLQTKEKHYK